MYACVCLCVSFEDEMFTILVLFSPQAASFILGQAKILSVNETVH